MYNIIIHKIYVFYKTMNINFSNFFQNFAVFINLLNSKNNS